jgi:hypothetical protein
MTKKLAADLNLTNIESFLFAGPVLHEEFFQYFSLSVTNISDLKKLF